MLEYPFPSAPSEATVSAEIVRKRLPQPWCESLLMSDGRQLLLRPITAADAEPLRAGFALLNPQEVRMRFMHPMKELTPEMARRLTRLDPRREFALVIAEPLPPGEALIAGVVRAAIDDGRREAEFAILVSRFLAGQGLGRLLMRRIIRWARLKRLDALYGDVLEENASMLKLADALGFTREHRREDPGVIRVRLPLQAEAG